MGGGHEGRATELLDVAARVALRLLGHFLEVEVCVHLFRNQSFGDLECSMQTTCGGGACGLERGGCACGCKRIVCGRLEQNWLWRGTVVIWRGGYMLLVETG